MKKRSLNIFDAGIAFVLSFVLAQFTAVIGIVISEFVMDACGMSATQIDTFWNGVWGYLLQGIYMNIAFIAVFIWYYVHRDKQPMLTNPTKPTIKYVGYCILIGVASLFLLSGILNYFQLMLDKLNYSVSTLSYEINSPLTYIISLISLAVLPAVCEELLFRGIITTSLKQKGETFAIFMSSAMFAIFHFSPSQLIYPFCFGLILSIVYLRTRNIIFPILLHFINNALTVSIQYFSNSSSGTFTHSTSTLVYAIITFAVWIYIIYRLFMDFKQHSQQSTQNTSAENNTEDNISQNSNIITEQTQTLENDKLNHKILYGSIILMILIYILLLFA